MNGKFAPLVHRVFESSLFLRSKEIITVCCLVFSTHIFPYYLGSSKVNFCVDFGYCKLWIWDTFLEVRLNSLGPVSHQPSRSSYPLWICVFFASFTRGEKQVCRDSKIWTREKVRSKGWGVKVWGQVSTSKKCEYILGPYIQSYNIYTGNKLTSVAHSSVIVRFVLTKLANGEPLIWSNEPMGASHLAKTKRMMTDVRATGGG